METVCCICMKREAGCKHEPCNHEQFFAKCVIKTLGDSRLRCPDCRSISSSQDKFCMGCTFYAKWNHLWKCPLCRQSISKLAIGDDFLMTDDLLKVMYFVNKKQDKTLVLSKLEGLRLIHYFEMQEEGDEPDQKFKAMKRLASKYFNASLLVKRW